MRREPKGSVLVTGLGLTFLMALALLVYLSMSGVLHDRQRGQHLADMAALSVASWQAQTLNYQAYANRAIIANELMIAQTLSMLSYVQHVESLTDQAATLASLWPGFREIAQTLNATAKATREVAHFATQAEIPFRSAYTHALMASQVAMHRALTPFAAQALVNEVVWSADKRYFGQTVPVPTNPSFYWSIETSTDLQMNKNAKFIQASLEQYSQDRGFDQAAWFFPNIGCVPRQASHLLGRLVREGTTMLSHDHSAWVSNDSLSLHRWRASGWFGLCRGTRELWPLSWGKAEATSAAVGYSPPGGGTRNPQATSRANQSSDRIQGYLGLARLHHLSPGAGAVSQTFRVPVVVRLQEEKSHALQRLRQFSNIAGSSQEIPSSLWALSIGLTEFRAPRGEQQSLSVANGTTHLYPFWHARLDHPTRSELIATQVTQGVGDAL
ncbi:MAG: hypothetical protein RL133_1237 [Pseudomonadota bacterium]